MQRIILIVTFLSFTHLLFSQDDERIKVVRKIVDTINKDKTYKIKKLENSYFVDQLNEATDGGQELTGYYKNETIIKFIYYVGLSYGNKIYEYYFKDNQLIFVLEKQVSNSTINDSLGINNIPLKTVFEGRYYFNKGKLFETKKTGKEWFVDTKNNKQNEFLSDSKLFIEKLKNAKVN